MKTVEVTLGGKKYEIKALSLKKSREWRGVFQAPFEQIVAALSGIGEIELTNGEDLARVIGVLKTTLLGSTDLAVDMLFAYSPELAAARATIEEQATDDEALAAFVEVLKLAYPFGGVLRLVQAGRESKPTSKNSSAPSGVLTTTS